MNITEPAITVKINQTYREGMSSGELYEISRGIWKIDKRRRDTIRYVLAVADGVVKEVYEAKRWQDAGTDRYQFRVHAPSDLRDRSEFVGEVAPAAVRDKYIGRPFKSYQTVNYFNCD
ncbi:MAG: hypothetical protein IPI64_11890 [Chloracidobacterium sp.]|nr:hypothetical protein [Chloracidobacterium sp.]